MSRAERLFALYFYLDAKSGRTLTELARRFEVSERTIFRDLSALEASGVVIEHADGRYRRGSGTARPVDFDSGELELVRLALVSPAIEKTKGPLGRAIRSLIDKLDGALRDRRPSTPPTEGPAGRSKPSAAVVAETLELAIRERRPVVVRYRPLSGGAEQERGIDPWHLLHRNGSDYLVGRCRVLEGPRLFRIDRIATARLATGTFQAPPGAADEGLREA